MIGYSTSQAARLARLTYRQLDNLVREGVVCPSLPNVAQASLLPSLHTSTGTARRFSERDVAVLSVIATLREAGMGYAALRIVVEQISGHSLDEGWLVVALDGTSKRCESIRKLGAFVAALSPAHVVPLTQLQTQAA